MRYLPCLLAVVLCGCATRGFPPVNGVLNFEHVDENLYRGAQPTRFSLEMLKARVSGPIMDINLRQDSDTWVNEEQACKDLGIDYVHVPLPGLGAPKASDIETILAQIENAKGFVFVHCQHGCDRTGTVVACWRIRHQHWSNAKALSEAKTFGQSPLELGMKSFIKKFH